MTTNFATPVFGIKAKLVHNPVNNYSHFATPVFGIKAKLGS